MHLGPAVRQRRLGSSYWVTLAHTACSHRLSLSVRSSWLIVPRVFHINDILVLVFDLFSIGIVEFAEKSSTETEAEITTPSRETTIGYGA